MKHRQDKEFRGGGHPYNKLLSRIEWSQIVENCECALKRLLPLPSAVTLGEILISMAIIGALVLILMPILQSVKPDENEAMHKKTTFVVERVVNELSSDDYLYPNNGEYSSLSNTDSVTYNGVTHGGLTKFCTLFASRINKKPGTEVNCTMGAVSVTSVEGVDWYLPISNFRNGSETLMVDVNGGEEPNELGEDRFEYQIQPGFKVPTIEVTHYENATERPDNKATVGNVVKPDHEDKAGLGKYNIACTGDGHATILGVGSGKVNGNYTLVAIPKPGYKCNWFTRQVTVKDADVTDCALSCSPDSVVPESDGGTTPGGDDDDDDDDDDDEEPKNPVNVIVNWSGESGCNYICDKNDCMYYEGELYKVTITGDNGKHLEAVWLPGSSGSGVIMGEETVIERAECKKVETQKCYDIKPIVGNPNHCPYQLPAGNCPNEGEENKYLPNQDYGIVVSPEEGYTFNNTPDKSTYTVKLGNSDAKPDFRNLCKSSSDNEATIVIDTEEFKSSSANGAIQTVSAITSVTVTNDASVSGEMTIPKNEFHYPQRGTGYDRPTDPIKVKFSIGKPSAKYTTYHAEVTNTLTMDEKGYYGYYPVTCDLNINGTKVACDAKTATVNDVKYTIIYTGPPIVSAGPPGVDPDTQDKIEIKVGSLSATYGGYNPTGTTPSVSYSNGTVTVKTAQDVTISGLSVVPSNSSKPWKIKKTGSEESHVVPSSGSGTKAFTVELAKNHFTGGCVYAEYNDKSASSDRVCFKNEDIPGGGDACSASNKYNIKVTEKQDSTVDKYFAAIGDPNSSIVGGGPWYTSNLNLSNHGEGTVNGGTKLELTFNKPSPGGTVNGVTYEAYVKSVTANGKSQNTGSYSVVVCENQNITVEYGMKEKTAPANNCAIKFTGSGSTGGAAEGQCTVTSGNNGPRTITLNKGNNYTYTLSNLTCGIGYSFGCSGTATGATYKLTPSPASIASLSGTQDVDVNFEKVYGPDSSVNVNPTIRYGNVCSNHSEYMDHSWRPSVRVTFENTITHQEYYLSSGSCQGKCQLQDFGYQLPPGPYKVTATLTISANASGDAPPSSDIELQSGSIPSKITLNAGESKTLTPTWDVCGGGGTGLCAIQLSGKGDVGNGVEVEVSGAGDNGISRSATLTNLNYYSARWDNLKCNKSYVVSVKSVKDTNNSSAKFTTSISPSSTVYFPATPTTELLDINVTRKVDTCSFKFIGTGAKGKCASVVGAAKVNIGTDICSGEEKTIDVNCGLSYYFSTYNGDKASVSPTSATATAGVKEITVDFEEAGSEETGSVTLNGSLYSATTNPVSGEAQWYVQMQNVKTGETYELSGSGQKSVSHSSVSFSAGPISVPVGEYTFPVYWFKMTDSITNTEYKVSNTLNVGDPMNIVEGTNSIYMSVYASK